MGIKQERIESIINRVVNEVVQFQLKDPSIGFITITNVEVTNDYSYAKIYVTFLGKNARQDAGMKALNRAKGFIRKELSGKLSIRKTPELIFVLDTSFEKARKIDQIIQEIHSKQED